MCASACVRMCVCVQVSRVAQRAGTSVLERNSCDLFSNHPQGHKSYIGQLEKLETKTFPLFCACNFPSSPFAVLIFAQLAACSKFVSIESTLQQVYGPQSVLDKRVALLAERVNLQFVDAEIFANACFTPHFSNYLSINEMSIKLALKIAQYIRPSSRSPSRVSHGCVRSTLSSATCHARFGAGTLGHKLEHSHKSSAQCELGKLSVRLQKGCGRGLRGALEKRVERRRSAIACFSS